MPFVRQEPAASSGSVLGPVRLPWWIAGAGLPSTIAVEARVEWKGQLGGCEAVCCRSCNCHLSLGSDRLQFLGTKRAIRGFYLTGSWRPDVGTAELSVRGRLLQLHPVQNMLS